MKKIIVLVMALVVCIILIPKAIGAGTPDDPEPEEPNSVTKEFAAIETVMGNSDSPYDDLSDYLIEWAETNGYECEEDDNKNILITKPAKNGYEKSPVTILHGNNKYIGSALYVLKTSATRGCLKVLYTHPGDDGHMGAEALNPDFLEGDYLISVNDPDKNYIANSASGNEEYILSKQLEWTAPENLNAFEISLNGFSGGDAGFDNKKKKQNPIKIAGNFLATAKSQGIILELASINGGTSADSIPQDVSFIVVVNEYDAKRINTLFENTSSAFDKNYGSAEKEATFTIKPVDTPEKVLSKESANTVISYLYGFSNGIYATSEEDSNVITASSNLGTANTSSGNFESNIAITTANKELAAELNDAHYKLCYLTGMDYNFKLSNPAWNQNMGSTLFPILSDYYDESDGKKVKTGNITTPLECAWFRQKNQLLDIVWLSIEKPEEIILKFLGD